MAFLLCNKAGFPLSLHSCGKSFEVWIGKNGPSLLMMKGWPIKTAATKGIESHEYVYLELRMKIMCAAQLDSYVLDDAATELSVDYEVHPFENAKSLRTRQHQEQFVDSYEGFVAMMEDGFADTPIPECWDSSLKGFENTITIWLGHGTKTTLRANSGVVRHFPMVGVINKH